MNVKALAEALRDRARRLSAAGEQPVTLGELGDDGELLRVLACMIEGKTAAQAFGAPGDWGYSTQIGKALAAKDGE